MYSNSMKYSARVCFGYVVVLGNTELLLAFSCISLDGMCPAGKSAKNWCSSCGRHWTQATCPEDADEDSDLHSRSFSLGWHIRYSP